MSRQFRVEQAVSRHCPDDWREWPMENRRLCDWAVTRELMKNGGRIVGDESCCTEAAEPIYPGAKSLQDYRFVLSRTVTIEAT